MFNKTNEMATGVDMTNVKYTAPQLYNRNCNFHDIVENGIGRIDMPLLSGQGQTNEITSSPKQKMANKISRQAE